MKSRKIFLASVLMTGFATTPFTAAQTEAPEWITFSSKLDSMKEAGVGSVVYPHKIHEALYQCDDCHPKIFVDKIGANDINMQKNIDGMYCGSSGCHNSAEAFPLYLCEKCHSGKEKTR